ncbi:MAG: DUF748 domain-containing protein [Gammaproteobacteria bacterium]
MIKKLTLSARQRKGLSIIVVVAVLYTLAGFFLLPTLLRQMLPDLIRDATGRDSRIAAVAFDPYRLNLQLQGFELQEKNGQPFVKFAELYTDFNVWRSLQQGLLSFSEVRMEKPYVHVDRRQNGTFNYDDLFPPAPPEEPEMQLLPFEIESVQLRDGVFDWQDRLYRQTSTETAQSVNLTITDLTTRQDAPGVLNISLALASGATLSWNGKLTLNPLHSEGRIEIRELPSRRLEEWLFPDNGVIAFSKGVYAIDTEYRVDYRDNILQLALAPLQLNAKDLVLNEKGEKSPFIAFKELQLSDTQLQLEWTATSDHWHMHVPQGQLHVKKFALSNPRQQKLHFALDDFVLEGLGCDLLLRDTLQFNASHRKVGVKNASFAFEGERTLKIAAARVDVGPTQFSARRTSPQSALELHATQNSLNLKKLAVSLPVQRETLLDAATVAVGKVQFALRPRKKAPPEITVSQNNITAEQLTLRQSGQKETLASMASITAEGMHFDLDKKLIDIAAATSTGSKVKAWLANDGTLNYQTLFFGGGTIKTPAPPSSQADTHAHPKSVTGLPGKEKQPPSPPPSPLSATEPTVSSPAWTTVIGKFTINDGTLDFEDRSRKPQTAYNLSAINAVAENFTTAGTSKIPLRFSALFDGKGKTTLQGDIALQPPHAAFDVKIEAFPLPPLQPYVERFARLDVLSGALDVNGKWTLDIPNGAPPQMTFRGAAGIARFHSRDQLLHKDFAKWEQFTLRDVAFDLQPLRCDVAGVQIEHPYLRVAIDKDKSVNLADIVVNNPPLQTAGGRIEPRTAGKQPADVRRGAAEPEKAGAPAFNIRKIQVRQGRSDFSDFSLIIPFAAFIDHLDGQIEGISSQHDSTASLTLQGLVLDMAPVAIDGQFQPYRGASKISITFDNLPLPATTPYMAEFAGYKIEKGKMSLQLDYQITGGKLQANNKIQIDQLELGDKIDSPRAVSLPLELAVALLKDTQGRIKLDFPISGSLEDPQFSIGAMIVDALSNIVGKAVTAPFRAVAALLGRRDGDMGRIEFKAGSAVLSASEIAKLDGIADVFAERKVLKLDVKGIAYQQQDWPELTDEALREQIENLRAAELRRQGKFQAAENVELSAGEYRRLLADLFIAKFPQRAKRSLFGTPELINGDKRDFYTVAAQKLREGIPPDPSKLAALAAERGRAIARYMIRQKGVDGSRVFVLGAKVEPGVEQNGIVAELLLHGS